MALLKFPTFQYSGSFECSGAPPVVNRLGMNEEPGGGHREVVCGGKFEKWNVLGFRVQTHRNASSMIGSASSKFLTSLLIPLRFKALSKRRESEKEGKGASATHIPSTTVST